MYKTLIIEDEQRLSEVLLMMLNEILPGKMDVIGIATTVSEAVTMIDTMKPELVFMDIQLKDGNSFQVLDSIVFHQFYIIFTTAYEQHAIRAFRYSAIDYLLKPVDATELKQAVEKIEQFHSIHLSTGQIQQLQNTLSHKPDKIFLPTQEGIHMVLLADIIRCETSGSYTTFHIVGAKKITVSKSLKSYDDLLTIPQFFRIHQSHTINFDYVKIFNRDGTLWLKDDTVLQVAQRRKEEFVKWITSNG